MMRCFGEARLGCVFQAALQGCFDRIGNPMLVYFIKQIAVDIVEMNLYDNTTAMLVARELCPNTALMPPTPSFHLRWLNG